MLDYALRDVLYAWIRGYDHANVNHIASWSAPHFFTIFGTNYHHRYRYHHHHRMLTTLCAQKPRIHTKATDGENLCLFCYSDDKLSPVEWFHLFYSLGILRAHINRNHLPIIASLVPVNCPYPVCAHTLRHGDT